MPDKRDAYDVNCTATGVKKCTAACNMSANGSAYYLGGYLHTFID